MDIDVLASDRDRLVLRLPADEYLGRGMVTLCGGVFFAFAILLYHYQDTRGLFVGGGYEVGRVWEALTLTGPFWVHSLWHLYRAARGGDVVVFDRRADTVTRNGRRLARLSAGVLALVSTHKNIELLELVVPGTGKTTKRIKLDAVGKDGSRLRTVCDEIREWTIGAWRPGG